MIFHEIITINKIFYVRFFIYNLLQKSNPVMGEQPKYFMQYLDMAWDNKYLFTFSRKLEVMSNN